MAIAGSVAPVFRDGGYDATATYDFYHALIHNNRLCFCRQDGTIGHEPQEESDEYWFISLDGNIADAVTLNGKSESELSVADSAKLGGKGASEYVNVVDYKGGSTASVGVSENGNLDMISFTFSDGTRKLLKWDNEIKRLVFSDFDGSVWSGNDIATTADLANYLPKSGGKLQREGSTPIEIESLNGMMSLVKFLGMGETLGFLGFSGKDTPVFFHSDGANAGTLLHTGNKPTGTYTGNGSSTSRYFSVPSTSKALVIYSNYGVVFVFNTFFVIIPINGEIIRGTGGINYDGTTLGFYSTETWLNASGITYTYYVL